jgi:leucyl aminopeptidase
MKITLPKLGKTASENDLLIIGAFKAKSDDKKSPKHGAGFEADKAIKELDKQISGFLINAAHEEGFLGDEGQSYLTATLGKAATKSIALLGLGASNDQSIDLFRRAGGEAFKLAYRKRAKKISIVIPEKTTTPLFDVVQALSEGLCLANYRFDRYQKDKKETVLKEVEIHLPQDPNSDHKLAAAHGQQIAESVCLARDLINEGPMELNPVKFAEHAEKVAQESGLKIDILDEKKLKKEKMNLMLAVASASQSFAPPRLIKLHYQPKKPSKHKIVLVGKGVTFDSGGLDIKTADGMLDMKVDMSGAAAVLGTMCAISKLQPKVEVVGYMACVENGVGPRAYHPGDILISRKGTSVEIANTDAEGRLVLADTITYAIDHDKPDIIIDIATLTGACMVALGLKTAGLFANDDGLADAITQSGQTVGESFWRMPLNPALKEIIKSPVADIKNCGDRYGGSITAALFLADFIEKDIKWAHLDIAGPATNNKPHSYLSTGGVGFGVRTLTDYLMSI